MLKNLLVFAILGVTLINGKIYAEDDIYTEILKIEKISETNEKSKTKKLKLSLDLSEGVKPDYIYYNGVAKYKISSDFLEKDSIFATIYNNKTPYDRSDDIVLKILKLKK